MSGIDLAGRLKVAEAVVREGGALALSHFKRRDALTIEHKGLQDLVSIADRSVEDVIRQRLGTAFPEDEFLGEERGGGEAEQFWVIDPIDGTANFLRGMPYWCVAIAYVAHGEPLLALTYDAVHDELFTAQKGQGTRRNGAPVQVSSVTRPNEACIGLSHNFKTPHAIYEAALHEYLAMDMDHRRMGSAALTLAHVSDGRLDAAVAFITNVWDVIGGLLLITEAGGKATTFLDHRPILERRTVVGSAPGIAEVFAKASGAKLG